MTPNIEVIGGSGLTGSLLLQDKTCDSAIANPSQVLLYVDKWKKTLKLDSTTNPTASMFLNPNLFTEWEIKASEFSIDSFQADVIKVKYTFLYAYSGVSFVIGDNLVNKVGIYNDFLDTNFIYIDELYEIDKQKSTPDQLFLKKPIKSGTIVFKAYSKDNYLLVFDSVVKWLADKTNELTGICDLEESRKLVRLTVDLASVISNYNCGNYTNAKEALDLIRKTYGFKC